MAQRLFVRLHVHPFVSLPDCFNGVSSPVCIFQSRKPENCALVGSEPLEKSERHVMREHCRV